MKRLLSVFQVLIVCVLVGCCVHSTIKHPSAKPNMVDELKTNTVALIHMDDDGDWAVWCSGVWVDVDKILTADHCVRAPIEEIILGLSDENDKEKLDAMIQAVEDGYELNYITSNDSNGIWRTPKKLHVARIVHHDKEHDLALLSVDPKTAPAHTVASIAQSAPSVGDNVNIMGHVAALTWTYTRGMVSAYREENFKLIKKKGPFMQIAGEVFYGNSGGGGFNDDRELVGIASSLAPVPNESFFVHIDSIRTFLARR